MELHPERLKEKGWSKEEIAQTQKILGKIKKRRHPHHKLLGESVFWGLLFLVIGTIIAVSYWIAPLFIYSQSIILYPILIIVGLTFGMLFSHIIKDLDHLQVHHHIIIHITLPATAIISFVTILGRINATALQGVPRGSFLASVTFIISYFVPYLYHLHTKK